MQSEKHVMYLTAIWAIKNERTEFTGFVSKITRITEALIGGFFNTSGKVSHYLLLIIVNLGI